MKARDAYEADKKLQEYCKEQKKSCYGCVFHGERYMNGSCALENTPYDYNFNHANVLAKVKRREKRAVK